MSNKYDLAGLMGMCEMEEAVGRMIDLAESRQGETK